MTKDDIIRMARQADIDPHDMCEDPRIAENSLEHFAALIAAAEREACAIAGGAAADAGLDGQLVATAIRARGEKE
jgi:hypothetical protein